MRSKAQRGNPLISRRDFTKAASIAAGGLFVSSDGRSQEQVGHQETRRWSLGALFKTLAPRSAARAKLVPQGKLETVPETGHSVYFQRPEVFNRLVFNFFEMHRGHDA